MNPCLEAPQPADYQRYWVMPWDEKSPILGVGFRAVYVKMQRKHVSIRDVIGVNRDVLSFNRWGAVPHVLDIGQPWQEALALLRKGGEPYTAPVVAVVKHRKRKCRNSTTTTAGAKKTGSARGSKGSAPRKRPNTRSTGGASSNSQTRKAKPARLIQPA